ncbi:MAG: GPR endopeptidase [Butyricicoccus pullicaecorum]|nr:GPR endopeptidase [Butyricicoccus pullicaecorum]MDO4668976.1 GPR endopeptidase [Butyricicoccus pullicaecorum]
MAFRTDLAQEALLHAYGSQPPQQGISENDYITAGFSIHSVEILTPTVARQLGKPVGRYCTLQIDPLTRRECEAFPRAVEALSGILTDCLHEIQKDAPILVIGLGNRAITPDAVGPLAAEHILVTRHLRKQKLFASWRPVSAAAPGVLGQTGVESAEFVQGLCQTVQPAAIIVIDALAAGALSHLTRTIQVTDAGIVPGSGVGNARSAFNSETFGVPVIAIGMPTVIDGASILPPSVQQESNTADALPEPVFVTPREIDLRVHDAAKVIGYSINRALHPHLALEDLDLLLA